MSTVSRRRPLTRSGRMAAAAGQRGKKMARSVHNRIVFQPAPVRHRKKNGRRLTDSWAQDREPSAANGRQSMPAGHHLGRRIEGHMWVFRDAPDRGQAAFELPQQCPEMCCRRRCNCQLRTCLSVSNANCSEGAMLSSVGPHFSRCLAPGFSAAVRRSTHRVPSTDARAPFFQLSRSHPTSPV